VAFEKRHQFRLSERAWKAFLARAQELNPREIDPLLRAGGLPFVVSSLGYNEGRMDYLSLDHTAQPPFSLSIYAKGNWVVCAVWSEEEVDIPVAQSLVKRLSNWMRSLESEHQASAGAEAAAGQCAEMPLRPQGSQHAAGSRQDAPSESPTGDSGGTERPKPPRVGASGESGCAKCVAQHDRLAASNPAASGSDAGERATGAPASCADANVASAEDALADAAPSAREASGGDESLNPPVEAGEAPREWSTVPSAAVAREEDAAVRRARRNILRQFARHASAASNTACRAYGGQFASIRARTPDPALVRQLRQIFARLAQGGETEPSARWDSRRVALKTAGYLRSWTTHDRRLESGRPAILVLPDVSGSMGKFAVEVAALAAAVAELGVPGADVLIVVHSNGSPIELQLNRGAAQEVRVDDEETLGWYERLVRRYEVKLALVAADWDGEWLYRWLASRPNIERLVWLDVYCSSYGEPRTRRFPPKWLEGEAFEAWKPYAHKVRYADRCSSAADCVAALAMLTGGMR
jgi:hypothetical protein